MADASTPAKLTTKQEAFCIFIVAGDSQIDAYRKAFNVSKAKRKSIDEQASRLMAKVKISARITEMRKPLIERAVMSRQAWLDSIARIAQADSRKMFDTHGNPLEITELPDNEAAAIAGFEFLEEFSGGKGERIPVGVTKKFKLADKLKALELYGKAQCYYAEKMELTGKDGSPIQVNQNIKVEFV